jgi:hypothetical protein
MRHALFNTTFIGTDAGKETSLPQSASHEATKDTIDMLLQTVSDAQGPQIQTPCDEDLNPINARRHVQFVDPPKKTYRNNKDPDPNTVSTVL